MAPKRKRKDAVVVIELLSAAECGLEIGSFSAEQLAAIDLVLQQMSRAINARLTRRQ
jgi:hypothetical protein